MIINNLFKLAHKFWLELQLGSPLFIQNAFIPHLHLVKEILRLLANPYLTLYQWQELNEVDPLTVNYVGLGYAKTMLRERLFTNGSTEKEIGRIPFWQLEKLVNSPDSNITIIELSKHLIHRFPHQMALILPFRIQLTLDIRGEWSDVEKRFHRNVRRNARKAREYGDYEFEVSYCEQDLEMFYHEMYLPTVYARHDKYAEILPKNRAYQLLRHGCLFLLKRDGVHVCGSLAYIKSSLVDFKEMGVFNGDLGLMKQGVVEAMNYLRIRWAHQLGYKMLSFGDNWPFLSGVFQAKRKWGSRVSIPSYEHKRIWLRIQRNTPAVSEFLQNNPCVSSDEQGRLYGFIATSDFDTTTPEMKMGWCKLYATPGFTGLIVCSSQNLLIRYDVISCPTTE